MKKALTILLAVLLVVTAALTLSACSPCKKGLHDWDEANAKVTQQPTCEEEGLKTVLCSRCGEPDTQTIPKVDHDWDVEEAAVEPSCDTAGNIAYKHCSMCNKYYNAQGDVLQQGDWVLEAAGSHTIGSIIQGTPATCDTPGTKDHYHCTACGKDFADAQGTTVLTDLTVAALGHTYKPATENTWVWANDYSSVTLNLVCASDATHTTSVTIDDVDVDDSTGATCQQAGTTYYTVEITKTELAAKLTNGVLHADVAETLTDTKTLTQNQLDHNYQGQPYVTDPENAGKHYKLCKYNCGTHTTAEDCQTALAWDDTHHYLECTEKCGYKTEEELHSDKIIGDSTGHWLGCTKDGCGVKEEFEDHNYTKYNKDTEGYHWDVCEDCDYEDVEHKTAHVYVWQATATTHQGTCVCLAEVVTEGHHTDGNHHDAVPSTSCLQTGTKAYDYCDVCHYYIVDGQATDTLGDLSDGEYGDHDISEVTGNDATCTENGVKHHWHCSVCSKNFEEQTAEREITDVTITKKGHDYPTTGWTHDSTDAFGKHHVKCKNCDEVNTADCTIVANNCATCTHTYTAEEIVDALYNLASGKNLPGTYKLTGLVTAIVTDYSDQHKNITVDITVANKTVRVYRVENAPAGTYDVKNIVVDTTITVLGTLTNYNGIYEFAAGCTLEKMETVDYHVNVAVEPADISDKAQVVDATTNAQLNSTYQGGTTITFKINVTDPDYAVVEVTVNGEKIKAVDGVYTIKVLGETNIVVTLGDAADVEPEPEKFASLTFGKDVGEKDESISAYNKSWDATRDGFTWHLSNINNNSRYNNSWNYVKAGLQATIDTDSSMLSYAVQKVVLNIEVATLTKVTSIKLYISTSNNFSAGETVTIDKTSEIASGEMEFDISDAAANKYYRIEIVSTETKVVTIKSVDYYKLPCTHKNVDETSAKESTCQEKGYEAYWTCRDCGKMFSNAKCTNVITEPIERELAGHTWVVDTTKGNQAEKNGWTWEVEGGVGTATVHLKCSTENCTQTHDETLTIVTEEHYEVTTETSCTAAGKGTYTVTITYAELDFEGSYEETIAQIDHKYDESKYAHDDQGNHWIVCDYDCGTEKANSKTVHTYTTFEESKTTDDTHTYSCVCGEESTNGHVYTTYVKADEHNHKSNCDTCGHEKTSGHTYSETATKIDGNTTYHKYNCTANGCAAYSTENHDFNNEADTCKCGLLNPDHCDHEEIRKVEHVAATCTEDEVLQHWVCDDCEKMFSDEGNEEIGEDFFASADKATGHSWKLADTAWTWATDASSVTLNLKCDNCEETNNITINSGIEQTADVAEQCLVDGHKDYKVTVQRDSLLDGHKKHEKDHWEDSVVETLTDTYVITIRQKGHDYDESTWVSDGNGNHYYVCNNGCGINGSEEECDDFGWRVKEDGCEEYCKDCNYVKTAKQDHAKTWVECEDQDGHHEVCTRCGKETTGKQDHNYADYNYVDEQHHSATCGTCHKFNDKLDHRYGAWTNSGDDHIRTCADCTNEDHDEHHWGDPTNVNNVLQHQVACTDNCGATKLVDHVFTNGKACACGEAYCTQTSTEKCETIVADVTNTIAKNTTYESSSVTMSNGVVMTWTDFAKSGALLQTRKSPVSTLQSSAFPGRITKISITMSTTRTGKYYTLGFGTDGSTFGDEVDVDDSNGATFVYEPTGNYTCFQLKHVHSNMLNVSSIVVEYENKVEKHNWVRYTDLDEAPNCTESGKEGYICSKCKTATKTEDVNALGHSYQKVDRKEAECGVAGWEEHYKCTVCDAKFRYEGDTQTWDPTIEALAHDMDYRTDEDHVGQHQYYCKRQGCTHAEEWASHESDTWVVVENHYKNCDACGTKFDEGDHDYTYNEADHKCVCGKIDPDQHEHDFNSSSVYMPIPGNSTQHAKKCATCNELDLESPEDCEMEWVVDDDTHYKWCETCDRQTDNGTHEYSEYVKMDDEYHAADCDKCGETNYEIPHNFTSYTPIDGGKQHNAYCADCEENIAQDHKINGYTKKDNGKHDAYCTDCAKNIEQDHSYGSDNKCACGDEKIVEPSKLVIDFKTKNSSIPSAASSSPFTFNNMEFACSNLYQTGSGTNNYIMLKAANSFIANKTAVNGSIVKIEVLINSQASTSAEYYVGLYANAQTSAQTNGTYSKGAGQTITVEADKSAGFSYFNITQASSKNGQIVSITISYYE